MYRKLKAVFKALLVLKQNFSRKLSSKMERIRAPLVKVGENEKHQRPPTPTNSYRTWRTLPRKTWQWGGEINRFLNNTSSEPELLWFWCAKPWCPSMKCSLEFTYAYFIKGQVAQEHVKGLHANSLASTHSASTCKPAPVYSSMNHDLFLSIRLITPASAFLVMLT